MSHGASNPNPKSKAEEIREYVIGAAMSVVLTVIAFGTALGLDLSRSTTLTVVGVTAVLQILAQLRWFFHLDFSPEHRESLGLIAFTLFLLFLMAGGTIWIMGDLSMRM